MTITIILLITICIVSITLIIQYYLERYKSSIKHKLNIREIKNKLQKYLHKSINKKDHDKRRTTSNRGKEILP